MSNKLEATFLKPDPDRYHKKAKQVILEATKTWQSHRGIIEDDLYIVWFCKTLQNWKALVSTDFHKGNYYEVTYNGDKNEAYVDVYNRHTNVLVTDEDLSQSL